MEERFKRHEWTVKVDLDTVFYADRLRRLLTHWNCGDSCGPMHIRQLYTYFPLWQRAQWNHLLMDGAAMFGPLQVLNTLAVDVFAQGFWKCTFEMRNRHRYSHIPQMAFLWGDDHWANIEDVFVDRCMSRLSVWPLLVSNLLRNDFGERRQPCGPGYAAYHPHKSHYDHLKCVWGAKHGRNDRSRDRAWNVSDPSNATDTEIQ